MAIVIPDGYGIAQLVLQLTGRPAPYIVTHGFDHTALTASSPDAIAGLIVNAWQGATGPLKASNFAPVYKFLRVHTLMTRGTNLMEGNVLVNLAGTASITGCPSPQVSFIVRKRTALAGIKFRGRMYFPPMFITETNIDELGMWGATQLTAQQTLFNGALTALTTAQVPAVLLHSPPKPPGVLPPPTLITSLECEAQAATQRRRLR